MNINLIFSLLIVNDYLRYLCEGCISSKLTIFFSAIFFQQRKILLVKVQQKEFNQNIFPTIKQNSSPVNVSLYSKRFTKTLETDLLGNSYQFLFPKSKVGQHY